MGAWGTSQTSVCWSPSSRYTTAAYVFSRLPASRVTALEYMFPPVAIVIAFFWMARDLAGYGTEVVGPPGPPQEG